MKKASTQIDLQIIKNPDSPKYLHELHKSTINIDQQRLKKYYSILIKSINLNENVNEVFGALCKSLAFQKNFDLFIAENFIDKISYLDKPILDLLYIIISKDPQNITSKTIFVLSKLVSDYPREVLVLVAIYAQKSNDKNKSWQLFDLILKNYQVYIAGRENAFDYLSLLRFIACECDLEQNNLEIVWSTCCYFLQSTADIEIINTAYSALQQISGKYSENFNFPLKTVNKHLHQKELERAALSFMLHCPPPSISSALIDTLVNVATEKNGIKATLILIQISRNFECAQKLVMRSKWMSIGIPTFVDTMKLFAICLSHKENRPIIIERPELITFLNNILSIPTDEILSIICTFLKRLPLNIEILGNIGKSGFFALFFERSLNNNNIVLVKSGLIAVHIISQISYIEEFLTIIKKLAFLVDNNAEVSMMAASNAVELCRYPDCLKSLKKIKFDEIMKRNQISPKMIHIYNRYCNL